MERRIRPLAMAIIRRGEELLVEAGRDETKGESFFRLLGGEIEFGEQGGDALRREFQEEIGAELEVGRVLGAVENRFSYEGQPGHEIVLLYECRLSDDRLYDLESWKTSEQVGGHARTYALAWKPVASFADGSEILYPEGVLELAR